MNEQLGIVSIKVVFNSSIFSVYFYIAKNNLKTEQVINCVIDIVIKHIVYLCYSHPRRNL